MIVLTLVGFLVVFTVTMTLNSNEVKEKRIATASQTFYSNIAAVYNDVLLNATDNYSLENLKNATGNAKGDNKILLEAFARFANGYLTSYGAQEGNCDDLIIQTSEGGAEDFQAYKTDDMVCAIFPGDIIAGLSYNDSCAGVQKDEEIKETEETEESKNSLDTIIVQEYAENKGIKVNSRVIENTCGYIIYGFKYGRGIFGEDLFVIGLSKRSVK